MPFKFGPCCCGACSPCCNQNDFGTIHQNLCATIYTWPNSHPSGEITAFLNYRPSGQKFITATGLPYYGIENKYYRDWSVGWPCSPPSGGRIFGFICYQKHVRCYGIDPLCVTGCPTYGFNLYTAANNTCVRDFNYRDLNEHYMLCSVDKTIPIEDRSNSCDDPYFNMEGSNTNIGSYASGYIATFSHGYDGSCAERTCWGGQLIRPTGWAGKITFNSDNPVFCRPGTGISFTLSAGNVVVNGFNFGSGWIGTANFHGKSMTLGLVDCEGSNPEGALGLRFIGECGGFFMQPERPTTGPINSCFNIFNLRHDNIFYLDCQQFRGLPTPYMTFGGTTTCTGDVSNCCQDHGVNIVVYLNAIPEGTHRYKPNLCCPRVFPPGHTLYATVTSVSGATCMNGTYPMMFYGQDVHDCFYSDTWCYPTGSLGLIPACTDGTGNPFGRLTLSCPAATLAGGDPVPAGECGVCNDDGNSVNGYNLRGSVSATGDICYFSVCSSGAINKQCTPFFFRWENVPIGVVGVGTSCCGTPGFPVALVNITITE